jgi:hypothetical protein
MLQQHVAALPLAFIALHPSMTTVIALFYSIVGVPGRQKGHKDLKQGPDMAIEQSTMLLRSHFRKQLQRMRLRAPFHTAFHSWQQPLVTPGYIIPRVQ